MPFLLLCCHHRCCYQRLFRFSLFFFLCFFHCFVDIVWFLCHFVIFILHNLVSTCTKKVINTMFFLVWNLYLRWWLNGFASFSGRPFLTAFFFWAFGLVYSYFLSIRLALTLAISSSSLGTGFLFDLKQHPILSIKKFLII